MHMLNRNDYDDRIFEVRGFVCVDKEKQTLFLLRPH